MATDAAGYQFTDGFSPLNATPISTPFNQKDTSPFQENKQLSTSP